MDFLMGLIFGTAIGMAIAIIITCVGGAGHEEEAYKEGYDRGFSDGMREARFIWTGRERKDE